MTPVDPPVPDDVARDAIRHGMTLYLSGGFERTSRGINPDVKATVTYSGDVDSVDDATIARMADLHSRLLGHAVVNVYKLAMDHIPGE